MLIAGDGNQLRMVALRGLDRLAERGIGVFQLCLSVKVNCFCALHLRVTVVRYICFVSFFYCEFRARTQLTSHGNY